MAYGSATTVKYATKALQKLYRIQQILQDRKVSCYRTKPDEPKLGSITPDRK